MVGAQDYVLFRLCFCEGHRTLLPPSCHLVQKRECNVDAPLGPEQDLKLLFLCNPKDPLRISIKIKLVHVHFSTVLWAMGSPLHLAVPPPPILALSGSGYSSTETRRRTVVTMIMVFVVDFTSPASDLCMCSDHLLCTPTVEVRLSGVRFGKGAH